MSSATPSPSFNSSTFEGILRDTADKFYAFTSDPEMVKLIAKVAKLERSDQIVKQALLFIGLSAGLLICIGIGIYAQQGYCFDYDYHRGREEVSE